MKLEEMKVFDTNTNFVIAYEDGRNFCTEVFEKGSEWYDSIMSGFGNSEVLKIRMESWSIPTVLFFVDKEVCFQISRDIMNRYMEEDESWKETA